MSTLTGGARVLGGMSREGRLAFQSTEGSGIAALVSRCAARFRDAIRYARSRTTRTQDNERARAVAKRTLPAKPLKASLEDTTLLLVDCAARGAAVEAEGAVQELVAAIREARGPRDLPTLNEAWKAEEDAEAEREKAEAALITTQGKCVASRERFIRARAAYIIADEDMEAVVRQLGAAVAI